MPRVNNVTHQVMMYLENDPYWYEVLTAMAQSGQSQSDSIEALKTSLWPSHTIDFDKPETFLSTVFRAGWNDIDWKYATQYWFDEYAPDDNESED